MHANYVDLVVRRRPDEVDSEAAEVLAVRVFPTDDVDAEAVTLETRRWLLDGRHTRFLFEERRRYSAIGAEASSVVFVLELLASGAVGVALQEVVSFMKGRIGAGPDEVQANQFRRLGVDELRDETLTEAERRWACRAVTSSRRTWIAIPTRLECGCVSKAPARCIPSYATRTVRSKS